MKLSDAISAVENSASAYQSALTTTENDQANADAIQAKLIAAQTQVTSDAAAQDSAARGLNDALDVLIEAATSAKIPVLESDQS